MSDLYHIENIQKINQRIEDEFNHHVEILEGQLIEMTDLLIARTTLLRGIPLMTGMN